MMSRNIFNTIPRSTGFGVFQMTLPVLMAMNVSIFIFMFMFILNQCCGAETFCFRSGSGSDFQTVSAPALTLALYLPFITDFILKSGFFLFFMKEYRPNLHAGFYTK